MLRGWKEEKAAVFLLHNNRFDSFFDRCIELSAQKKEKERGEVDFPHPSAPRLHEEGHRGETFTSQSPFLTGFVN